jgi:hypothetical protein
MAEEQLRCNICGVVVSISQANQHASTSTHESRKSELEQELKATRKDNNKNDSSVVVLWENLL